MAVKNFVFRETWVQSEVAETKITFFTIFGPNWTNILALKGWNMEMHKQHFNFQSIKRTETTLLPIILYIATVYVKHNPEKANLKS